MARVYSWLLAASLIATSLFAPGSMAAVSSQTKKVQGSLRSQQQAKQNIIITMRERTSSVLDGIDSQNFLSRSHKVHSVREGLESHAKKSQQGIRDLLDKSGASFARSESYWLTNQVYVHGATPELVQTLQNHPSVLSVAPEAILSPPLPVLETASTTTTTTTAQWGVDKINAPAIWATGNTGAGVVVGIIDTGVRYTHQAIAGNFRQAYGWYDPEKKATLPYDATGHGTHVTGTVAGNGGTGVAPGSMWIMCKGCRANGCYTSDLLACFQFMLCPTTPDGVTKDCSKAPNVVNNSWGGGQGLTTFDAVIDAWRAAGIIPVFAAGNVGTTCATITSPGDSAKVITVGATDVNDALASFSSKGPTVNGLRKPDLSAPGALIRSSCYTGDADYCFKSGTSMATPHVSGAIALYISARPTATYDAIKQFFQSTAITQTLTTPTGFTCGNTVDTVFPNNQYGYGRIDAFKAVSATGCW